MLLISLLTVVCIITYTFEIIFGLAGTIMMLMVMTFFLDTKTLVVYSVVPQILVGSIGLMRSPKTVELRFLLKMLAFALLGVFVGTSLFYYFPPSLFHRLLAIAISIFGLYLVLVPNTPKLGNKLNITLDTLAGVSQALFGISGPIAMTRLMSTFEDKTVIRNYALAFFLSLNVFRLFGYLTHQTITHEIWQMMYLSAPFLAISLWYSNHIHFKVNDQLFRRVVAWIILFGGILMLARSLGFAL